MKSLTDTVTSLEAQVRSKDEALSSVLQTKNESDDAWHTKLMALEDAGLYL